jgi:hypothetical protein
MGKQVFKYAIVPHDGCWSEANLAHRGEVFNRELPFLLETYHEGDLPTVWSGLSVDKENISIGALKRAEDNNGYILRVVEDYGKATEATIDAPMFGRKIELSFTPMEIKTVLVPDDAAARDRRRRGPVRILRYRQRQEHRSAGYERIQRRDPGSCGEERRIRGRPDREAPLPRIIRGRVS